MRYRSVNRQMSPTKGHAPMAVRRTAFAAARKAAGFSQETLAEHLGVDRSTVARWETGTVAPQPWHRPKPAEALDVTRHELTTPLTTGAAERPIDQDGAAFSERIKTSQEEWLRERQAPGVRGRELTELAAWLYPRAERAPGGHVLAAPGWLLGEPVELDAVRLHWDSDAPAPPQPTPDMTAGLLPLAGTGAHYADYSRAVRDLVRPRLLENRTSYRLTAISSSPQHRLQLGFSHTTFFEVFNAKQLLAHEFKRAWLRSGRRIPSWDDLPLRSAIGSPHDPQRLLMSPGINTLTIRRGRGAEGPTIVLHERDGGKVADGGGLCHVMPAGEFQPSSGTSADIKNDFSLWRNIMREFSEEFLGTPEHDGSGSRSIDYSRDDPFARLEQSRRNGALTLWHFGLVAEPLELGVMQLTVAVVDAQEFDHLFADMVGTNDEGRVVGNGSSVPFTADTIDRLEPRLTASALTLLRLAWRDRHLLLS
jgi:transcriptional regulator with XRE-family HTH domain